MMDRFPGETISKYQVISEVGRGGMAIVYKAFDPALQRTVAIKVLPPQFTFDQEFVQRFQQEAITAANLKHPHIVTIHDVGSHDGIYYIVMEFLEGKTLDAVLAEEGSLPLPRAAHIIRQVADALDYAHQQGRIHRDIKPSNIIIGKNDHATLMDFGLVRAGEGSRLTKTGMVVGTPEYMSPEQAQGERVDQRSDVYSLGVVLYKMLTGRPPFVKSTPHAILLAHLTQEPPSPSEINRSITRPVEAVTLKALAKDVNQRYQSAGALARDLAVAITGKTPPGLKAVKAPTPPSGTVRVARPAVRRAPFPTTAIAIVALVALLVIGGGVGLVLLLGGGGARPTATPTVVIGLAERATATPVILVTRPSPTRTGIPATVTAVPAATTPVPTSTPRPSPRPTDTPRVVPTSTPTPLPPTNTPTRPAPPTSTPTRVLPPTSTPTSPPVTGLRPAVRLLGPVDGFSASGCKAVITLEWSPASLGGDEYYVVSMPYPHQGQTWYETKWLKEPHWQLPEYLCSAGLADGGRYQWSVTIMRRTGGTDEKPEGVAISQPGETRSLVWTEVVVGPTREPGRP